MSPPPDSMYDVAQVRRAFSRAAHGYQAASTLQQQIQARLLESLDYRDDPALQRDAPAVVLDVGAGPGSASVAMRTRWPRAHVVAVDLALPMLLQSRQRARWWRPGTQPDFNRVCADARALPFAPHSVDVLFSNLCLQWVDDLGAAFAGFRRVLKPGGMLLVSTFGPQTLMELRQAFAEADDRPHVSPFASIAQFGDGLLHAGFRDPVLDRDTIVERHADLAGLMRQLRAIGATNALQTRRHSLTGKARFSAAAAAYEQFRDGDGLLPASWDVIYAQAWAPEYGAPVREAGIDVASVPADAIPVRRRG